MALYFADDDTLTFGVQSSNVKEVAQFSSTTDDAFLHLYTNNYGATDNVSKGVVIGTSNYDKTATAKNDLYIGHIDNQTVTRVITVRDQNVGIRTSTPQASLHIVSQNQQDAFRVEGTVTPTAIHVDDHGHVGIGTFAEHTQALTVRGKLVVDQLSVGTTIDSSQLLTTYGIRHPSDVTYLDFGDSALSNIESVTSPFVYADNIEKSLQDIARGAYVYDIMMTSPPTSNITGTVTLNFRLYGTAPTYEYRVFRTSNNQTSMVQTNTTTASATISLSTVFDVGQYRIGAEARGIASPYIGRWFTNSNLTDVSVGQRESLGAPSVQVLNANRIVLGATYRTVSGVSYLTQGASITFQTNALSFSNLMNITDPRPTITQPLQILTRFGGTSEVKNSYTYANIFADFNTNRSSNTNQIVSSLSYTTTTSRSIIVSGRTSNLFTSTVSDLFSVSYVPSTLNESTMAVGSFGSMAVTSMRRVNVTAGASPSTPTVNTSYNGTSPTINDALYDPIDNEFVTSSALLTRTSYDPIISPALTAREYLGIYIVPLIQLNSFAIQLPTSNVTITSVFVRWGAGVFLDASIFHTLGGCAAFVPVTGNKYVIQLPSSYQNLTSLDNIYIVVRFTGSMANTSIVLSYE